MASTLTRMVFDAQGNLAMVVKPDDDGQLQDPAFAPAGHITVDVPNASYTACQAPLDLLTLARPHVVAANAVAGAGVVNQINAINAAATAIAAAEANPQQYNANGFGQSVAVTA